MAFQGKPSASMTFTLFDATGSRSTVSFDIPSSTLASAALAAGGVMRGLLANVTGCAIVSQSVTYTEVDDTPEAPVAGSRVERKGTLIFRTAAGKTARYEIPGINDNLVLPDGRLDEDSPALIALNAAMIAADALYSDSNGSDLRSLKNAYEKFRGTTKRQLPGTRSPDRDIVSG